MSIDMLDIFGMRRSTLLFGVLPLVFVPVVMTADVASAAAPEVASDVPPRLNLFDLVG